MALRRKLSGFEPYTKIKYFVEQCAALRPAQIDKQGHGLPKDHGLKKPAARQTERAINRCLVNWLIFEKDTLW